MWQPDWSLLLPELLQSISEKITCITDYIYFRAVCWRWRLATLPIPHHLTPQLPWLLLPRASREDILIEPKIQFYGLSWSEMRTLRDPVLQGSRICGASRGWIILERNKEVFLLNPVTRANIPVSSLSGVPNIFPTPEKNKLFPANWILEEDEYGSSYMQKAILTSSPLPDSGCMVVGLFTSNWDIAFCRIGDEHWTVIEERDYGYYDREPYIQDIAWHDDKLYAIDLTGGVYIYDLLSPSKQYVVADIEHTWYMGLNLVEGASKLMAVVQLHPVNQTELQRMVTPPRHIILEHEVFEWRNDEEKAWHQVLDIGDVLLFINLASICISIPCANVQSERWRGGQICYEKWGSSSLVTLELDELTSGDGEEIDDMEELVPGYSERPLWLTPSYF